MSEPTQEHPYALRRPGGDIDRNRFFNAPAVVMVLAALMILSFVLTLVAPGLAKRVIETAAAVEPIRFMSGSAANGGVLRMTSPLIAHMFVHANIAHLAINTLFFLAFGAPVARRMGAEGAPQRFFRWYASVWFAAFYFMSGILGALAYSAAHTNEASLLVGASGGVSGLLGALVRFAFNRTSLFGPETARISPLWSSPVMVWSSVIVAMNIAAGLFGAPFSGGANIAWEAHLGGYFFGLLAYPAIESLARAGR
jgi:membrane associated rhomboid family serine protease